MTTEDLQQSERLAELRARRSAPVDNKRAAIGKILAAGLTSTTVFGITAALGWSATSAAENDPPPSDQPEQLVLDLATGQLVKYVNGVAVSAQQVADPNQLIARAQSPVTGTVGSLASSAPTLPANWNPGTPSSKTVSAQQTSATPPVDTAATTLEPSQPTTVVVEPPVSAAPQLVTIPIAVPQPTRSGGGSSGGGGGSSSSS